MGWFGLCWFGLGWDGSGWFGLSWVGLDWFGDRHCVILVAPLISLSTATTPAPRTPCTKLPIPPPHFPINGYNPSTSNTTTPQPQTKTAQHHQHHQHLVGTCCCLFFGGLLLPYGLRGFESTINHNRSMDDAPPTVRVESEPVSRCSVPFQVFKRFNQTIRRHWFR